MTLTKEMELVEDAIGRAAQCIGMDLPQMAFIPEQEWQALRSYIRSLRGILRAADRAPAEDLVERARLITEAVEKHRAQYGE